MNCVVVPKYFDSSFLAAPSFSKKNYLYVKKQKCQEMLSRGEVELLDAARRIYRMTQLFRTEDSFRARSARISLNVPRSLQRVLASETTRRPMMEAV
jgi:hypothetical protein